MKRLPLFFATLFLATSLIAQQEPDLVTDRPDQTESALVVPAWRLQIETGIAKEWVNIIDDESEGRTRYGTTLLRFGLFNFMELRLGSDLLGHRYKVPAGFERNEFGASPIGVGMKFKLVEEMGRTPDIALITSWQIPNTGNAVYSSDKWHHSFVFSFAHTLYEGWGLGYNLGYEFVGAFEYSTFKYSVVGAYSWTERWGLFIEGYGSKISKLPLDLRADAGITFLLFPSFQLDLSGGVGLTNISPVAFISAGFSWRIPR
jgi:hypothetical protein